MGSCGYTDSGEENRSFTGFISDFWNMTPHGDHSSFSSKQKSLHIETLQMSLHPPFTTSLHKGQKGKRSPQKKLPNTAMAKRSSPGTLITS